MARSLHLSFICIPQSTRALDQGGVEPRQAVSPKALRPWTIPLRYSVGWRNLLWHRLGDIPWGHFRIWLLLMWYHWNVSRHETGGCWWIFVIGGVPGFLAGFALAVLFGLTWSSVCVTRALGLEGRRTAASCQRQARRPSARPLGVLSVFRHSGLKQRLQVHPRRSAGAEDALAPSCFS